ncbi:hypothetical protein [Methylobacterium segetis]|uniref:hypothetical protein n=1 Tax=Methylobacterium segetis TaxID=2488750 RepID=UPI00104A4E19|nr:hypothetical protein [Methylobacterium segetis]
MPARRILPPLSRANTRRAADFARRQALLPEMFEVSARLQAVAQMRDTVTGARITMVTEGASFRAALGWVRRAGVDAFRASSLRSGSRPSEEASWVFLDHLDLPGWRQRRRDLSIGGPTPPPDVGAVGRVPLTSRRPLDVA